MLESLQQVQTIQLGSEFYQLVEVLGEHPRLAWEETFEDENAYQGGTPNILFAGADTWHMGAFKSREGFLGTSEYGQDTDGRWPNKLIPGPKISTITLPNNDKSITQFFEAFNRLFVCAGRYLYRIDPSDDSVTLSKDFGTPEQAISGVWWEGKAILATSKGGAGSIYDLSSLGSPDSWGADTGLARRLAVGVNRIFKVSATGVLKNCLTGLDATVEANYSDEVQVGSGVWVPTAMVAYERTVLVGLQEGLFGVDDEGKAISLIGRMPQNSNNCEGMYVVEPYVLVPHGRGVYRFIPGSVESVGLEKELLNESPVRGPFRALTADGPWIYGIVRVGTSQYIMVGRDVRPGENSFGPYVWDTLGYRTVNIAQALHVSRLWSPPRVFTTHESTTAAYFKLSEGGGAPDPEGTDYRFVTSGTRYTNRYHFADWKDKDFLKVDAVGKGCDATTYWIIWYSVDSGAYAKVDIDGVEMRVDENKLHTFVLPTTAKGREVQFKLEYVGAADSAMGQLVHFKPYAVPHSLKLRHYSLTLLLSGELQHDGGIEQRTSIEQLNDLYALTEASTAVDCKGPWGDITVHPKRPRVLEVRQEGHELPRFLVEFVVQKRETS